MKKQYILGMMLIGFLTGYIIGDTLNEVPEANNEPTAYELLERVR